MVELKIELPENFLKEEERSGYVVSQEMKKVWAVELDLLCELKRVCEKYNITYYADSGTMLGAVRHKGFIPWDDDIDIMMFRKDYEYLCEVAPSEFKEPYFFQTEYTDVGTMRGHAQLRNSNTTGILKKELGKVDFNQGIFIDIFPLDAVVEDEELAKAQEQEVLKYKSLTDTYSRWSSRYKKELATGTKGKIKRLLCPMAKIFINGLKLETKAYKKFELACQKYNHLDTAAISTLSFDFANKGDYRYREDLKETIDMPFEFITLPVCKGYDHALKCLYGDYMKFVVGGSLHGEVIFNTEISYRNYLKGE